MGACGAKADNRHRDSSHEEDDPPPKSPPPQQQPQHTEPEPQAQPDPEPEEEKADNGPVGDGFDEIDESEILTGIRDAYEILNVIGRGGFSVVHKGKSKKDGQFYALKHILKDTLSDVDDIKLLKREICIMKRVNHPNILHLYEVYEEEDDFWLVMELVQGKELFDRIVERGQYSERDASYIVKQISSAVDYLHSIGIAHRDLKPENLLSFGEPECIKLADFGFSKNFGEEKMVTSVGSPGYVAPEVLTQETYDMNVDMWSVGVIVYILLCGYPPFYADTTPELFKKIINVQYDFEDPNWDYVSDGAKDLIRHLLVKDSKKRYTARQCLEHPWVQGQGVGDAILSTGTTMVDKGVATKK